MKYPSLNFVEGRKFPDIAGAFLSALCFLHCAIAPVLMAPFMLGAIIPFDCFGFGQAGMIHDVMFLMTLAFGISAVYLAARHGKHMPVICLTVGLLSVSAAEFFLHDLAAVRLPGTLCVVGGHLWAMRKSAISKSLP